jgi:hypothetical protein
MTLVMPLAAYFGLVVVAALRFPVLRSRQAIGDDTGSEPDGADMWATNHKPRFPYFG